MSLTDATIRQQRELEVLFAACAFSDPWGAVDRCGWLLPATIQDEKIRRFWSGLLDGHQGDAAGAALDAGCFQELAEALNSVPNVTFPETYANEIQERAWMVQQDRTLAQLMDARTRHDICGMQEAIRALNNVAMPAAMEAITTAQDMGIEFLELLNGDMSGQVIPTGLPPLDRSLGGLGRKVFYILASRPSMGKTTLAWQIARNVSINNRVIYFSNEMTAAQLWSKASCGALGVQWRDVITRQVSADQLQALKDKSNELMLSYEDRLMVDDRTSHTVESMWRIVSQRRPVLVVVDVIASLKNKAISEVQRLAEIAGGLKDLGKNHNCAVIAIHHVNRASEHSDSHRPTMADLRDSGGLEQTADAVLLLHSDDYYRINAGSSAPAYLKTSVITAKNREGARNVESQLAYDTVHQWFLPASDIWREYV